MLYSSMLRVVSCRKLDLVNTLGRLKFKMFSTFQKFKNYFEINGNFLCKTSFDQMHGFCFYLVPNLN